MSQFDAPSNNTAAFGGERQPLSGAQNAQPAPDYSTDISERADDGTTGFDHGQTTHSGHDQTKGFGHDQTKGFGHDQTKGFGHDQTKGSGHGHSTGFDSQTKGSGHGHTTGFNGQTAGSGQDHTIGQTTASGHGHTAGFDGQTTGIDQGGRFENRKETRDPKRAQGFQPAYDIDGQPKDSSATRQQPTQAGGAGQGNHEHDDFQQHGKASMTDKVIGKAQQMTGKLTSNPEKQEMGEVRGNSGKAAANDLGDSRTSSTKF